MTRRRIGSGASAVSFGLAAGLAAAGGFATATALGLAGGGAGVLPSTGSAIVPLSDLATRKYESRQKTNQYSKERILGTTSYISASPVLSRRIPVSVRPWRCLRGSHFGPRCATRLLPSSRAPGQSGFPTAKLQRGVTPGTGELFSPRKWRAQFVRLPSRLHEAGAALQPPAEFFVGPANRKELSDPRGTNRGGSSASL